MSTPQQPQRYTWPDGMKSACCISVDVDAEAPYLWARRAGMTPFIGQLEQRRFGPRVGIGRLFDLLASVDIRGSFFLPAAVAELHPDIAPAIVGRGHELALHGYFHESPTDTEEAEFEDALDASIDRLLAQTGVRPAGFRSPGWEMTRPMLAALAARGLAYDSSLMGFEHPYEIDNVVEIPVHWQLDDAVHFKFLGGGGDRWPPASTRAVGESWHAEWQAHHETGGLFMITVHPWIIGRAARIAMLRDLLSRLREVPDVWWASAAQIAEFHRSSSNAGRFAVESAPPPGIGPRRFKRN